MHWLSANFYMETKFGPLKNKKLRAIKMKFFRRTGYTLFDDKRNEILEELKVELADQKLRRYKSNWL